MNDDWIWSLYAKVYDTINQNVPYLRMLEQVVNELELENTKPPLTVLDAGCGTGNIEARIPPTNRYVQFTGVDNIKPMLERARKKCSHDSRMKFLIADLNLRLPFGDSAFSRIVSMNSLYAVSDPQFTLQELYRVLKPGGKMVVANPHDRSSFFGIMAGQRRELGVWRFLLGFLRNLPALIVIMLVNALFLRKNSNYWDEMTTQNTLASLGMRQVTIQTTYAGQDLLVTAIK